MANERLNIPTSLKVGFNSRSDTYSGKLAYVTYINSKGEIAKQTSWENWRDKKLEVQDHENVPTEGFVLNKRTGGYKSGWNFRQTKCRVYDPRGFEVEISVENLLYILQECTSTKGKGLEGEFVYAWNGPELILLPVCSEDYKAVTNLMNRKEVIKNRDVVVGSAYKGKESDYLIFIGAQDWYIWSNGHSSESFEKSRLLTFVDPKTNSFVGYKNVKDLLDYKIEDNAITPEEVATYVENFKSTPAFQTQFITDFDLTGGLEAYKDFQKKKYDGWGSTLRFIMRRPTDARTLILKCEKTRVRDGLQRALWVNKNKKDWSIVAEQEANKEFDKGSEVAYVFRVIGEVTLKNNKVTYEYYDHFAYWAPNITESDLEYAAKMDYYDVGAFVTTDGKRITRWKNYGAKSRCTIHFNKKAPLPGNNA